MAILAGPQPSGPAAPLPAGTSADDAGVPSNGDPIGPPPDSFPEYEMPVEPPTDPAVIQALLESSDGEHHRTAVDGTAYTVAEPALVEPGEDFRADPPKEVVETGGTQP